MSAAAPAAVSKSKSAGCEATVSHGTPAHQSFCLASALRGSVSVPHPSLFALLHCTVSDQPVRKPSSHGCLSWAFIVGGVGPQSSLNIAKGLCLLFCFIKVLYWDYVWFYSAGSVKKSSIKYFEHNARRLKTWRKLIGSVLQLNREEIIFHICCEPKTWHFLNVFPVISGYEWGKHVYLNLQHFIFTFFIKSFSFTLKQPVIWPSDLFMLTFSSYKHSRRTIGDVSQPAARCVLFTATDCERRALISPRWSASVCVFSPHEVQWHGSHSAAGLRGGRWSLCRKGAACRRFNGSSAGMPKQLQRRLCFCVACREKERKCAVWSNL